MSLKAAIVPVTPFQQNCTVLWDDVTKLGAVIDPGGDIDRIKQAITKAGFRAEKIVLTHGHIDHAGGAFQLKSDLGGIPIEGPHIGDKFLLDGLEAQGRTYGFDAKSVTPDLWLDGAQTITMAGQTFAISHCPGHSPGSLVYFNQQNALALVGDVLFQGSIGRTDFPYGDHDALIKAVRSKVLTLGDDVTFIPGHGSPGRIGEERRTNPFVGEDK
jgi:hydroxyacylglutathione hydrolase